MEASKPPTPAAAVQVDGVVAYCTLIEAVPPLTRNWSMQIARSLMAIVLLVPSRMSAMRVPECQLKMPRVGWMIDAFPGYFTR